MMTSSPRLPILKTFVTRKPVKFALNNGKDIELLERGDGCFEILYDGNKCPIYVKTQIHAYAMALACQWAINLITEDKINEISNP